MFLTYLTLISAISISIIAAGYSIYGLAALFSGAATAIIIMGAVLEIGKLVMASWLYNNWNSPLLPKSIKYYLTTAVVVLVFITSVGIFGFLSKAHLDQVVPGNTNVLQIHILDEQITQRQKTIDRSQGQLTRMDELVETQSKETSFFTSSSQRAISERKQQKEERLALETTITESLDKINTLSDKRAGIQTEQLKLEADLGPIKYVAEFIYGDTAEDHFDEAVRWIIIILIFVFDPVAVLMLVSANISLREARMVEVEEVEPSSANANEEVARILAKQKKIWKKERDYEKLVSELTDEELSKLSPDEIRLKLSQIYEWNDKDNDRYRGNI
jgi:hypothetical protein